MVRVKSQDCCAGVALDDRVQSEVADEDADRRQGVNRPRGLNLTGREHPWRPLLPSDGHAGSYPPGNCDQTSAVLRTW